MASSRTSKTTEENKDQPVAETQDQPATNKEDDEKAKQAAQDAEKQVDATESAKESQAESEDYQPAKMGDPPKGKIIKEGEDVSFEGEQVGDQIIVKEDVYREVFPRGTKRPHYVLLAAAGTAVPAEQAQKQ